MAPFHYVALHLSPMGRSFQARTGACPGRSASTTCLVRLPLFFNMTDGEQDEVIRAPGSSSMASEGLLSVVIPVYRSEALPGAHRRRSWSPAGAGDAVRDRPGERWLARRSAGVIDGLCANDPRIRGRAGRNIGQHRATLLGFAWPEGTSWSPWTTTGRTHPRPRWPSRRRSATGPRRRLRPVPRRWSSPPPAPGLRGEPLAVARDHTEPSGVAITNVRALRGDLARALGAVESPYPYIDALIFRMTRHDRGRARRHRPGERSFDLHPRAPPQALGFPPHESDRHSAQFAMVGSFGVSISGFAVGRGPAHPGPRRAESSGRMALALRRVTFLFSVLFAFLGIISAYLGRMYISLNERDLVWTRSPHLWAVDPGPRGPDPRGPTRCRSATAGRVPPTPGLAMVSLSLIDEARFGSDGARPGFTDHVAAGHAPLLPGERGGRC